MLAGLSSDEIIEFVVVIIVLSELLSVVLKLFIIFLVNLSPKIYYES